MDLTRKLTLSAACAALALASTGRVIAKADVVRTVYFSAIDAKGVLVTDLTAAELSVKEGGKDRAITAVAPATAPLQVFLIVDDAGSGAFQAGVSPVPGSDARARTVRDQRAESAAEQGDGLHRGRRGLEDRDRPHRAARPGRLGWRADYGGRFRSRTGAPAAQGGASGDRRDDRRGRAGAIHAGRFGRSTPCGAAARA